MPVANIRNWRRPHTRRIIHIYMNKHSLLLFGLAVVAAISCNRNPFEDEMGIRPVHATISNPVSGDGPAVKALSPELKFSFAEGDFISVCSSTSSDYMNYGLVPDPENPKTADFRPSDYSLLDKTYYAVYPRQNCDKGPEEISVSFTGQVQTADGSTEHLAAYDYCRAEAAISNSTGNFAFSHRVSWLIMTIAATEAASITEVTISADDGVANSAVLNIIDDQVALAKKAGDRLTLKLGDADGIAVQENGTLTAYVTIPADTYTNLTLLAKDAAGHKYLKVYSGSKVCEAGKFYAPTLLRTDIPEASAFTALTDFGIYSATDTDSPSAVRIYDEDNDQISFSTNADNRKFRIFNVGKNDYVIITVSSADITVGEEYTVTGNVNGKETAGTFKAVNKAGNSIWLENKTDNTGCIISIE